MAGVACYTSFTYAYLSRARVLADSIRRLHPDWRLHALITDLPPAGFDAAALGDFHVVTDSAALDLPQFRPWLFKHGLVEACTAVKGAMLCRLLAQGASKVIYLDPDIALFAPLDPLLARLDAASIVLTPHQTEPSATPAAMADNERTSLRYGIYNLGFLGVRNDPTGRAFADWWAARLHEACYDAPATGLFTDQKYCDLVPGLFPGVHIERDPGCNVASWNLGRRPLAVNRRGELTAAGRLLRFYHFTKIGGVGDRMTERAAGDNLVAYELLAWYRRALRRAAVPGLDRHPWYYGRFSDGVPIPHPVRQVLRERPDLRAAFADPFDAAGGFRAWLARERPQLLAVEAGGKSG